MMNASRYLFFLTSILGLVSFFQASMIFYLAKSFAWTLLQSLILWFGLLLLSACYFLGDTLLKITHKAAPIKYIGSLTLGATSIFSLWSLFGNGMFFLGLNSPTLAWSLVILNIVFFLLSLYFAKRPYQVTRFKIQLKNASPLRVVQISDLHLNGLQSKRELSIFCEKINQLKADVIVFTGDLMDLSSELLKEELKILATLEAKIAKLAVSGNHDFYFKNYHYPQVLSSLGFYYLDNQRCKIKGMTFIGLPDKVGEKHKVQRKKISELLHKKEEKPVFLLDHRPESFKEAVNEGVDFQFSGHTHWGQIPPWDLLVFLRYQFAKGLKSFKSSQIYTSKGSGLWGPQLRFPGAREIVLFEFK